LHPTRDKTDWSLWLAQLPAPLPSAMQKNQHFDTMDLAITAAIQGFGVAIADETLVEEDLLSGRLVRPSALSVKTGASYRLVVREVSAKAIGLTQFRSGLLNPASHDDASLAETAPDAHA
jgi:LysR family glycine cleavage system transcriptional activator